jgi:hypothetical protein
MCKYAGLEEKDSIKKQLERDGIFRNFKQFKELMLKAFLLPMSSKNMLILIRKIEKTIFVHCIESISFIFRGEPAKVATLCDNPTGALNTSSTQRGGRRSVAG